MTKTPPASGQVGESGLTKDSVERSLRDPNPADLHQTGRGAVAHQQQQRRATSTADEAVQGGKPQANGDSTLSGDARGLGSRRIQGDAERDGGGSGGSGGQDGNGESRGQANPAAIPSDFRGDAILAGLTTPTRTPAAATTTAETRTRELAQLINEITDRVIAGERGGVPELRATLRGDLWGQTELRIARKNGGLEVVILAGNTTSNGLLLSNGDELANQLAQKLEMRVVLQLASEQHNTAEHGGDGRRDQRSRGLDDLITYAAGV